MGKKKDANKSKQEKKKSKSKSQAKEKSKPSSKKKTDASGKNANTKSGSSLFSVVSAGQTPTANAPTAIDSTPGFTLTAITVASAKQDSSGSEADKGEEPVQSTALTEKVPSDADPRVIRISNTSDMCQREDSQPFRFMQDRNEEQAESKLQEPPTPPVEASLFFEVIEADTKNSATQNTGLTAATTNNVQKEAKQQANLKGQEAKKIATGGVNQFDLDIVKTDNTEKQTAGERRARRAQSQKPDLLKAGPGILKRALQAERTLTGLPINTDKATRLNTLQDENKKRADLQKSNKTRASEMLIVMAEPFNQISVITNHIGLTGVWGVVAERLAQFPSQIGCVINATYEAPLLQVEGIEAYRIPVADSKEENLIIYFDEVTEKMHEFELKGMATLVHCIAGVSRSASIVIAYLMRYHDEGLSLENAFCLVKSVRTIVNPNLAFLDQLAAFEKKLHGEANCSPWGVHSANGITKRLPQFIIDHFIDDYQVEFSPDH